MQRTGMGLQMLSHDRLPPTRRPRFHVTCDECRQKVRQTLPFKTRQLCIPCWNESGAKEYYRELERKVVEEFPIQGKLF